MLDKLNSRVEMTEDRISELEDRSKAHSQNRKKINWGGGGGRKSLRGLWDKNKQTNPWGPRSRKQMELKNYMRK